MDEHSELEIAKVGDSLVFRLDGLEVGTAPAPTGECELFAFRKDGDVVTRFPIARVRL
jgi:hypothetical protein